MELPPEGLVISTTLADLLEAVPGDTVTIEVLEAQRPVFEAPVVATFETYIGSPAYMEIGALNRLVREPPSVTTVHLQVDPLRQAELFRELKRIPQVSAVTLRSAAVQTFRDTMAKTILIYVGFFIVFSAALAFGVTTTRRASRSPSAAGNWPRCGSSATRAARSPTSCSARSLC
jgi:putative ABC transport system permease protein